jgi:hypothetical protein
MARIKKTIKTKFKQEDLKGKLDEYFVQRKEIQMLLTSGTWQGNTLIMVSKPFQGTITVYDNQLEIDLEFTMFGHALQDKLQKTIDESILRLEAADEADKK